MRNDNDNEFLTNFAKVRYNEDRESENDDGNDERIPA